MTCYHLMQNSIVFKFNTKHIATRTFHCFLNRIGHFTGFTTSKTNSTIAITDDNKCRKTKHTAPFYHFRGTVHRN